MISADSDIVTNDASKPDRLFAKDSKVIRGVERRMDTISVFLCQYWIGIDNEPCKQPQLQSNRINRTYIIFLSCFSLFSWYKPKPISKLTLP